MFKKLIFLALIVFTSSCSSSSSKSLPSKSLPSKSLPKYEAWNKTNWLMSESEVINTFPGKVVTIEQAKTWPNYAYEGTNDAIRLACIFSRPEEKCTTLAMKDFEIGGENYNVFFQFTNNQLTRVKLICDGSEGNFWKAIGCFEDVNELLTKKYGEPIENEEKKTPIGYSSLNSKMKKWKIEHNNIISHYYDCVGCENNKGAYARLSYYPDPQQVPIKSNFYENDKDNI